MRDIQKQNKKINIKEAISLPSAQVYALYFKVAIRCLVGNIAWRDKNSRSTK